MTQDHHKTITRRSLILGALQFGVLGVLGARLAWLQVAQGPRYKTLSDKNRINIKMLPPSRGEIVDRFGTKLAVNEQNFRLQVIPEQTQNLEQSLRAAAKLIKIDEKDIKATIAKAKRSPKFVPVEIKDNLSWEDVAKIEVNLTDLAGLSIQTGEIRNYPYGDSTAHIVGYVSAVSRAEVKKNPVLNLPGFKTGKTGVEKTYDDDLRGHAGASEVEVNVVGREVRELGRKPSVSGDQITLTIDGELQKFVQERINQERSASAIIMDVKTGAVYALASGPSFDPNLFTKGLLSAEKWEELLANPGHPLTNKAIAGQYPPASTFKMVTALAALESGHATRHTRVHCPGHYDFGGDRFHCWKWSGHGSMDVVDALAESCDVYFYDLSKDVGIERIADMARKLGLGSRTDFEITEERPGLMPDKDWKMGYFGKHWRAGETIVASIGQGYIQTTPLQLAVMTSRIINGGYAVTPWITGYIGDRPGVDRGWPKLDIRKQNLALVKKGMDKTVNGKQGTAYKSRFEEPGLSMGGKTGTSQVRRITMEERREGISNADLPWKQRHHALFVGYAPVGNPRYACAVVIEHGGSGSAAAAPLARDILKAAQKRDPASTPLFQDKASTVAGYALPPSRKPVSRE